MNIETLFIIMGSVITFACLLLVAYTIYEGLEDGF